MDWPLHRWGDFQGLIQLSIALNGTFAVLSTFLGNVKEKSVELTEVHRDYAISIEKTFPTAAIPDKLSSRFDYLIDEFRSVDELYDNLFIAIIRQLCLYLAIIAIFFAIYAAFKFSTHINVLAQYYIVIQLVPFLLGIAYLTWLSGFYLLPKYINRRHLIRQLKVYRSDIEKSVRKLEDEDKAQKQEGAAA